MFMKLNVPAQQFVFLFRNEAFVRILSKGPHRLLALGRTLRVTRIEKCYPLLDNFEAELLLQDPATRDCVKTLLVGEDERAVVRIDNLLKSSLGNGRYFFYDPENRVSFTSYVTSDPAVPAEEGMKLATLPTSATFLQYINVEDGMRALLYYNNERIKLLEPGQFYFWKTARTVTVKKVDIRSQSLEIQGQELMTKDKVTLRINLSVRYRVIDVYKTLEDLKDFTDMFYRTVQMALREAVSTKTLDELLTQKNQVSADIAAQVKEECGQLGLELEASGIRDIILPGEMKTIMNQVIEAEKKSQAQMIQRREETAATRSLLNTAKLMEDNPILLRLKEMEASERIAEKVGSITVTGGFESLFKAIQPAQVLKV